jgi:hypothetical protein
MIWRAYRFAILRVASSDLKAHRPEDSAGITPLTHVPVWRGEKVVIYNVAKYIKDALQAVKAKANPPDINDECYRVSPIPTKRVAQSAG